MFHFGCLSAGALRRTKRSILSDWEIWEQAILATSTHERKKSLWAWWFGRFFNSCHVRQQHESLASSLTYVCLFLQKIFIYTHFPHNFTLDNSNFFPYIPWRFELSGVDSYRFVYRYSTTIFRKFSVQKLFTYALVVIQVTCISVRVSGD